MTQNKRHLLCAKVASVLLLIIGLAQAGFAQSAAAASDPPLNFANNFFVTGGYIVAGASGMAQKFTTINGVSYAVGTITVPDGNPGITGTKQVPAGAQIVAALLYWQSVEKVAAPGSGQNGYFRPLLYSKSGGPAAPGYLISGTNVSGSNTVSWSSGGCTGGSTGKLLRTYRADVAGGLPVDASGNSIANGSFEVRLPSVGNSTPLTLGATLVVIYRIPTGAEGPNIPLNSIVIYDGDYAQSNSQLTMTQPLQGFYDADHIPVSRLTHIVGSGQSNKFQTVYLGKDQNTLTKLPSLYGNKLPAFPGWYGTWDNPTWTFPSASTPVNPLLEDFSSATTQVVPSMSNQGCVSWGAVILSTTVKNSDNDGILDSWKIDQGYCDYLTNPSCSGPLDGGWIPLPDPHPGKQDIYLQYDYMCSTVTNGLCTTGGSDYSFDPRLATDPLDNLNAAQKVVEAFNSHQGSPSSKPFVLHAVPGNAILENQPNVSCTDLDPACPFPNELGTVGFREGLAYIKNQTIDTQTGVLGCDPTMDVNCVAVLHHGKKDSYHYALFSHGVGLPNWFLSDGSLQTVSQSGNTVTFTTSSPHGILPIAGDSLCSSANGYIGRVTIIFAITNQNLNGTYCAKQANPPGANKFAITLTNSSTTANYTLKTDPNLAVANGQVTSMSGYSDVSGQNSVISLGYGGWGPPNNPAAEGNKWNIKAGTFMHELGHTLGLTHGGPFFNNLANNDFTPTFEVNCKPNVQTVMSYVFQFDLLQAPGPPNQAPVKVLDFSEDPPVLTPSIFPTLTESVPAGPNLLNGLTYPYTSWFQLTSFSGASPATSHCDGTPVGLNENSYSYTNQPVGDFFWSTANPPGITGSDINFNGKANDLPMHPHNEWEGTPAANGAGPSPGVDLRQVSAVGTVSTIGPGGEAGGLKPAGGGGGLKPAGGGGGLHPAGGGGGLKPAGGGGGLKPAGGGGLSAEITHNQANSYARPPQNLFIVQEEISPRLIDLSWFAASFGTAVNYKIYRSDAGGPFVNIASVSGTQTTYTDTVTCKLQGYRYRVTEVVNNDAGQLLESVPSNIVPAANEHLLTGCYVVPSFSSPTSAVHGSIVQITWTLEDDFYATPPAAWATATSGHPVTNKGANTLVANGPRPGICTASGPTTILLNGVSTAQSGASTFPTPSNTGQFTFNWDTDAFCAGSYTFTLTLDSTQSQTTTSTLTLQIDVTDTDSTPNVTTTSLPDANVGVFYSNTVSQDGGVGTITWSSTGLLPPGITLNSGTGVLSGTPTAGGIFSFTVTATDSQNNTGTQTLTLRVLRDVVVVDGSPSANPLAGTLLRITPGTAPTTSVLANLPNGQPSAVAMDRATGNIYAAVASGAARIVRVSSAGVLTDPFVSGVSSGGILASPVAVAVDSSDNLYVGDNSLHAIYKFNSSGAQVDATGNPTNNAFATLPSSANPNAIRMTFDSTGNLIVASDNIGGSGVVEVDQIPTSGASAGTRNILYNTSTMAGTGPAIMSVGGIAVLSDGSIDVADTFAQAIYKIANPGTGAMAISTAIAATNTLCCNITGMTNPPSAMDTTLYVTVNGVTGGARVVLAVPETNSVSTLFSGSPLTFPNDITWFQPQVTYYVDGPGNFGTLDLTTGLTKPIGTGIAAGNTGMDLTPTGQVYEYNVSNQLVQINPSTGVATVVGSGTLPNPRYTTTGGLTNGSYFGIDAVTGSLYSIYLATGATTLVGPTQTAMIPLGCGFHTSLAGSANVLYYTIGGFTGAGCSSPLNDTLYQIDPTTGATTTIGQVSVNGFVGSAFVGGTLYGFTAGGQEYTIDLTTGVATFVTNTTTSIFGAASTSSSVF